MSLKAKLKRMEVHMKQEPLQEEPTKTATNAEKSAGNWHEFGLIPHHFEDQVCYIRETKHALDSTYGEKTFRQYQDDLLKWESTSFSHPLSSKGIPLKKLIFFDTETTGLSAGAGTQMFLLGFACFEEEEVVVRQYFLPSPDSESALYHYFLHDVGKLDHLVSFNGKAFDWPRLKTRHAYLRDTVPKLPQFGHYDLLHAARRLWKHSLPSCRLGVLEEEILGIKRSEDTPSHLIPLLYFDFVREQKLEFISSIFEHHEKDVLSLIALYSRLTEKITGWEEETSLDERLQLAKWAQANGAYPLAHDMFTNIINSGTSDENGLLEARYLRGHGLKKSQYYQKATVDFKECLLSERFRWQSAIELALMYEHYVKDINQAAHYAQLALSFAKNERERNDAIKRVERLNKK